VNKTYSDGCECGDNGYGKSCGSATGLGTLGYGGVAQVSNVVMPQPAANWEETWYVVQFPAANVNPSTAYAPHIYFSQNPGGQYVFDVYSNCSYAKAYDCQVEGGISTRRTDFSINGHGDWGTNTWGPTADVGNAGLVYIRVYRAFAAQTCDPYTLVVTD
jgi:hypothetical protein